jgi:hypothetical protein
MRNHLPRKPIIQRIGFQVDRPCFEHAERNFRRKRIMLRYVLVFIFAGSAPFAGAQEVRRDKGDGMRYYGKESFLIEGTTIPDSLKESPYDRLPNSYRNKVRPPVWGLSKASAGISVRFRSNSTTIKVRWELLNNARMSHMAETGIKGVDLYCRVNDRWQYVNTAKPSGKENEALLINNMTSELREYKMFLPLYDGVTKLEIGIDTLRKIEKPARSDRRPIVFYGTSITQGGCASRPGMAYTNIISRKLNVECVNYGFSGNGKMESSIAELLSEIDASFFVIDCLPNMLSDEIRQNAIPLVEIIRSKHPAIPIVFVEGLLHERAFLDDTTKARLDEKNRVLRSEYDKILEKGYTNIFYVESKGALGDDHEGTVDGVHFTDLGFIRFADYLISKFEQFKLTVSTPNKN